MFIVLFTVPCHKPPSTLYTLATTEVQNVLAKYAKSLAKNVGNTIIIREILDDLRTSFSIKTPRAILEDILNSFDGARITESRELCYYYLTLLRNDLQQILLTKQNSEFSIYEWNELFMTNRFEKLVHLDCGRNCTDHVLYLIGLNCPNLQYLNAMSRRKTFVVGNNATQMNDRITDMGLNFIAKGCQKLKCLVINDPRSGYDPHSNHRRHSNPTITTSGYRALLKAVPTLEYINYSNIGGLIANGMKDVDRLNLKLIQHYNPSQESVQEILRLCPLVQKFYIVSFHHAFDYTDVVAALVQNDPPLTHLSVRNINARVHIPLLVSHFPQLTHLTVVETVASVTMDNLIAIGKHLPALRQLVMNEYVPEVMRSFPKNGFRAQLRSLSLSISGPFCEKAVNFCLSQSGNTLQDLSLRVTHEDAAEAVTHLGAYLISTFDFPQLTTLQLNPSIVVTIDEILDLMGHFAQLSSFTGSCIDDTTPISCLIKENNLDFELHPLQLRSLYD